MYSEDRVHNDVDSYYFDQRLSMISLLFIVVVITILGFILAYYDPDRFLAQVETWYCVA
jgi:hypothetical protein